VPFTNPILAGEELVRSAIRSENWADGSDGSPATGWRITRDGDATFNSVAIRGDAEGESASFDSISANDSLRYQGTELSTLLDARGRGIIARAFLPPGTYTAANGVGFALLELGITMDADRMYRIAIDEMVVSSPAAGTSMLGVFRYTTDGSQPTVSGGTGQELGVFEKKCVTNGGSESIAGEFIYQNLGIARTFRVLLYIIPFGNTMSAGLRNVDMWIEDIGGLVGDTGVQRVGAPPPARTLREFEVIGDNFRSYRGNGTNHGTSFLYQGQSPEPSNGKMVSWCWFPLGSIGSASLADMAGVPPADIAYFEIWLFYPHWYYSSGGIILGGYHTSSAVAAPGANEPPGGIPTVFTQGLTGRNQGIWLSMAGGPSGAYTNNLSLSVRAGTFRGMLVGDHSTDSNFDKYGYASECRIRAGYYK
jgi:hypothetical protein